MNTAHALSLLETIVFCLHIDTCLVLSIEAALQLLLETLVTYDIKDSVVEDKL